MEKVKLGDVLPYEQPSKYIVKTTKYSDSYNTAVLTAGKTFVLGYTEETEGIYDNLPCIIFDDFTTATKYVNFPFKVKSSAMKILTAVDNSINLKYFFYLMQTIRLNAQTHKRFWISEYSKIEVDVPDLPAQEKIVEKIEELFSELDKGIEELTTAKAKLKVYRQAVLDDAFDKSNVCSLKECISSIGQGWSPKCVNENTVDNEVWAVIKTSAIQSRRFDFTENKILPTTLEPREQHCIAVGDLLVTRAGPRVRCGVCCLVKKTKEKLINCDKVYNIKLNEEKILPEYAEYVLNSPEIVNKIDKCKTGGSESGLNLTQTRFLQLEIPICDTKQQEKIVLEIESRLSICDNIEATIEESLVKAERLRQSILKEAFEGRLV